MPATTLPATTSVAVWYSTRATGVVSLVLLTLTMVLGILTAGRFSRRSWPAFAQADLHKRVSVIAVAFLAIHVLTAVLDTYVHIGLTAVVVPFASQYRPLWTGLGTVALDLMLAVALSSALRQRISARAWRAIHWLAYGSWPVAMAHALGEGTDSAKVWMGVLAAVCSIAVVGALGWRVLEYVRHRQVADRYGALTRAVPARQVEHLRGRSNPSAQAGQPASAARQPRVHAGSGHGAGRR